MIHGRFKLNRDTVTLLECGANGNYPAFSGNDKYTNQPGCTHTGRMTARYLPGATGLLTDRRVALVHNRSLGRKTLLTVPTTQHGSRCTVMITALMISPGSIALSAGNFAYTRSGRPDFLWAVSPYITSRILYGSGRDFSELHELGFQGRIKN